ncbi:siderophore ABC transporter substrate-binding protein [Ancylobacter sp. Lp-2]|uniref:siderophore ABC transporter substrate-binding protein n=1 Tax=Ancylobacter sp. Lp-2 TaxID=2881339 RepID=UPI001E42E736|nr:siderophore ABC transporter substrate-binding protein [Ancylobacter sp. Lp-2]MCB4769629.1 siderophore ABC transporter substrate-binding protein [Ancylobacter sp. Lp-2]
MRERRRNAARMRRWTIALVLLGWSAAAPVTFAADIRVRHAQGETVVATLPKTALVFDLAVLDTLDALGVEVAGVPASHVPDILGKYREARYLKIGSLFEPDFEAVNAAKPDLVIVAARSAAVYPQLARLAPTIDLTLPPTGMIDGVRGNVATLGRIFGKEPEAAALAGDIDRAAARVRQATAKAGTVLMVMVNGGKLTIFGPGSRFGWLYDELGATPAVAQADAATHGAAVSFEFILATDPDWLIVLDRDAAVGHAGVSARQVLDNEIVGATHAARSGRIVYVDPARWYLVGGGGRSFAVILNDLADALAAAH